MYQGAPCPILSYNSLPLSGHKRQIIIQRRGIINYSEQVLNLF